MDNGRLLKSARKKLDWTQQDLADYFKVERRLVSYWEQGQRTIPKGALKMARQIKRMKKKDAMCRFKPRSLKSENEHANRGKSVPKKKTQKKGVLGHARNYSLFQTLGEKNSQNTQSETFDVSLRPKQENTVVLLPEEGSMEYFILESYIEFKKKNRRFPGNKDFLNNEFKEATKKEVLQCFGSLSKAKSLASKLKKHLGAGQGNLVRTFPGKLKTFSSDGNRGFPCCCCGKRWRSVENFYTALREVINKEIDSFDTYTDAVQGLKTTLFGSTQCFCGGTRTPGFTSSFKTIVLGRLDKTDGMRAEDCRKAIFGEENTEDNAQYKEECGYCHDHKDYWEVSIDDSKVARFICEDCDTGIGADKT